MYVCCSDPEAWTAARFGKLGMAHFVFCDLGIGKLPERVQARKVSDAQRPLRSLAMADPEATSAILAVGKLIASCAKIAACGWGITIYIRGRWVRSGSLALGSCVSALAADGLCPLDDGSTGRRRVARQTQAIRICDVKLLAGSSGC